MLHHDIQQDFQLQFQVNFMGFRILKFCIYGLQKRNLFIGRTKKNIFKYKTFGIGNACLKY
jgi:hypothetical protein